MRCSCAAEPLRGALHTAGLFIVQLDDEVGPGRLFGCLIWPQANEAREPQAHAPVRMQVARRCLQRKRMRRFSAQLPRSGVRPHDDTCQPICPSRRHDCPTVGCGVSCSGGRPPHLVHRGDREVGPADLPDFRGREPDTGGLARLIVRPLAVQPLHAQPLCGLQAPRRDCVGVSLPSRVIARLAALCGTHDILQCHKMPSSTAYVRAGSTMDQPVTVAMDEARSFRAL